MNYKKIVSCVISTIFTSTLLGQEKNVISENKSDKKESIEEHLSDKNAWKLNLGGDIRLRYYTMNNLPKYPNGESVYTEYGRMRTRLGGSLKRENIGLNLRLTNEFRYYRRPIVDRKKQEFPDALSVDHLFFEVKDLGDFATVKIGRQDIQLGSKRVISDGTPGDGSRTYFFDGVRATLEFSKKQKLDLFAVYNRHEDALEMGKTRLSNGKYDEYDLTGNANSEAGIGAYYTNSEVENFPFELYYIWKKETKGEKDFAMSREFHTFGTRLLPKFNNNLSGEFEIAGQFGDFDSGGNAYGFMSYAGLTYRENGLASKPTLKTAVLFLSGDDGDQNGSYTGWNPVFGRDTMVSDITDAMYSKLYHSNLIYPHLEVGFSVAENHRVTSQFGPMYAQKKDVISAESRYRGLYLSTKYDWNITQRLTFSILGVLFNKGDYFKEDSRNLTSYLRAELAWTF